LQRVPADEPADEDKEEKRDGFGALEAHAFERDGDAEGAEEAADEPGMAFDQAPLVPLAEAELSDRAAVQS
jgi:hypothetical protein